MQRQKEDRAIAVDFKESHELANLETIEINPPGELKNVIIWMHGLGADGQDFLPMIQQLPPAVRQHTRFIFPHAPFRSITVHGGATIRGWYDIRSINLSHHVDETGIRLSGQQIEALIQQQVQDGQIPSHKIVLAGFSQGGAMALFAGLRHTQRLAGIIALSTYLPLSEKLQEEATAANQGLPLFQAHGHFDSIVPFELGQSCSQLLNRLNYSVEWQTYPLAHQVSSQVILDLSRFLERLL